MSRLLGRLASYTLFLIFLATLFALTQVDLIDTSHEKPYLLSLPDLSSPRVTLQTLIENGDIAGRAIMAKGVPWEPTAEILRMMDTVDVSDLSPARRELQAALAAGRLKFVIDHVDLPPMSEIPDAAAVKEQKINEWRLPNTSIVIGRATSGSHKGDFQFTPQTVALSNTLYDALNDIPLRAGQPPNIYEEFRYMPGPLVPRQAIAALPSLLRAPVFSQALWQWLGLILLLTTTITSMLRTIGWGVRHDARVRGAFRRYGQPLAAIIVIILAGFAEALVDVGLKLWGQVLEITEFTLSLIAIAAAAWFAITVIRRLSDLIQTSFALPESSLDAQLVKVTSMLIAIGVGIGAGFFAADFVGIPIGPLLAGLGIGGLAVALSVRPTLENVIGGLTLFADRPARVGEFCQFGNQTGTVEEIGLRTTKIRRRDDTLVTIANAELAQARIENFSRRRKYSFDLVLRLHYQTTMAQFQEITTGIRQLLQEHEKVAEETERVILRGLGDYALELEVHALIDDPPTAPAIVEELNLSILDVIRGAGVTLAYPSHTSYLVNGETAAEPKPIAAAASQSQAQALPKLASD